MIVTEKFLAAIKQVTDITENLILESGNTILIKGSPKLKLAGLVCQAKLDISIPNSAGISDTKQFQNLISLFDREELDIDFKEHHFVFKDGSSKSRFLMSPTELLDSKPKYSWREYEDMFFQDPIAEVDISATLFQHMLKAMRGVNAPFVSVKCENGSLQFLCHDPENENGNTFSIPIKEDDTIPNFDYAFPCNLMGAIQAGDYTMKISSSKTTISLSKPDFDFMVVATKTYSTTPD